MRRSLLAEPFNILANHPEVRAWLGGGSGPLDLTALVTDPENHCFLTDSQKGGYIYHKRAVGLYEVHTLSLPDGRGRDLLKARDQSLAAMFLKTDALEIVTIVPDGNYGAARWSAHAGFTEDFRRDDCIDLFDGLHGASYRSLAHKKWVGLDAENQKVGQRFHHDLSEYIPDNHPEDPIHDAWVGATIRSIEEGNTTKAIALYNRWAVQAGYEPILIKTLNPLVLDIRTAIIEYGRDGLRLLDRPGRSPPIAEDESASCPLELQPQPLA